MKRTIILIIALITSTLFSAPVLSTQSWANTDDAFRDFASVLEANNPRNLLARPEVTFHSPDMSAATCRMFADGDAGARGAEGRIGIGGAPTTIRFYLGKTTPIYEVAFYTFNIDARANQDYEVRFADNSANPGKLPEFPKEPHLTTGPKVIGPDAGGFRSSFANEDKTPIFPKADWVEFRIWRTYNVKAGTPAHSDKAESWTSGIEIDVFGDPKDVIAIPPEVLANREKLRALPRQFQFVKQDTLTASILHARQAILDWEKLFDDILQEEHGVKLGAWEFAGPYAQNAEEAKGENAPQNATWKQLEGLQDGKTTDLAKLVNAKPNDVIFLRRTATLTKNFSNTMPFLVRTGFRSGRLAMTSGGQVGGRNDLMLHAWNANGKKGNQQLLGKLHVSGDDGQCLFHFQPTAIGRSKLNAGDAKKRISRRQNLFWTLRNEFPDPASRMQLLWEETDLIWLDNRDVGMATIVWHLDEWLPHENPLWLAARYRKATKNRLAQLKENLDLKPKGIRDITAKTIQEIETLLQDDNRPLDFKADQKAYHDVMTLTAAFDNVHAVESTQLAVQDQINTFKEEYAEKGRAFLTKLAEEEAKAIALLKKAVNEKHGALAEITAYGIEFAKSAQDILLQNPLLQDQKLIFIKGGFWFSSNWGGPNSLGNEFVTLSPVRPDGNIETLFKTNKITDYDLDWDAKKLIYGNGRHIIESSLDGKTQRQITTVENQHVMHFDACYLPSGQVVFSSTACEQAVPCTGGWYVANLHIADADGRNERRLCYDQDHNWNPTVLNNGRVLFSRWEYADTPHYFTRLLFHMNPDGTGQMEYYGSNSYWPNSMFWPRPIPGHSSAVSTVITGHHGTSRQGELILLDPAIGRKEAQGVIQRIPGRGKKVIPIIKDGLVENSWPRFVAPYPLAEPDTNRGAGKYFLATMKPEPKAPWGLYLVDVFDNLTPILIGNYIDARPLRPRFKPPVITSKVNLTKKTGFVYMTDIRQGPGIQGYPEGLVKQLRIGAHHYRFGSNGDTYASAYEGGWDCKQIIGTVPVEPDGSAFFEVPANVPIFVQPLDADGKALQTMRSWFVAMPGETISCVGCHEPQNSVSPPGARQASRKPPCPMEPWLGPARGFGFDQEVQTVLDAKCVGCHNGKEDAPKRLKDLRRKPDTYQGRYSPSYNALHPYVRRAGVESDYCMQKPGEWDADTSPLIQLLKKGHYGVQLTKVEWSRLYTWIDFNVPYAPNWRQSHIPPTQEQIDRRNHFKKLHALIDDTNENLIPMPPQVPFVPPMTQPQPPPPQTLDNWPLSKEVAEQQQQKLGQKQLVLTLADGIQMSFSAIPPGKALVGDAQGAPDERTVRVVTVDKPFWLASHEVTNQLYALFDPDHDSAYMDGRGKDRITRGRPQNEPLMPVIRITWEQANEFCKWLSGKTGRTCMLPTEDEWEYACRAGTATPWNFGDESQIKPDNLVANISDWQLRSWNFGRCHQDINDHAFHSRAVGGYPPNRWGLYDMHGNVAEWTASQYEPNDPNLKVVRGGSWNDLFPQARSASRWRYPKWQPVYNVGFRVKLLW
jgi:formylglycine-generating enzyme required for sulfatase activity